MAQNAPPAMSAVRSLPGVNRTWRRLISINGCQLDLYARGVGWSDECPWRDIFCLLAEYCSRCCLFRMHICRNCQLRTGQIPICPSSAFIPIGNGRSALFTTRASRRSFLRRSRTRMPASRPRQRSPTSRPRRRCGRHLHSCNHPMPSSYNDPNQKRRNRSCNANAKLRRDAWRRRWSWWRGNRNLAFLATASGEQANWHACRASSIVVGPQLGAVGFRSWIIGTDHGRISQWCLRLAPFRPAAAITACPLSGDERT